MKKILALAGPSGAGKTHYRKEEHPDAPYIDIMDTYKSYPGMLRWDQALEIFINEVENQIREHDFVVVEARLADDSMQRKYLEMIAGVYDAEVEYKEFDAPVEVLIERIEKDYLTHKDEDPDWWTFYTEARLGIARSERR